MIQQDHHHIRALVTVEARPCILGSRKVSLASAWRENWTTGRPHYGGRAGRLFARHGFPVLRSCDPSVRWARTPHSSHPLGIETTQQPLHRRTQSCADEKPRHQRTQRRANEKPAAPSLGVPRRQPGAQPGRDHIPAPQSGRHLCPNHTRRRTHHNGGLPPGSKTSQIPRLGIVDTRTRPLLRDGGRRGRLGERATTQRPSRNLARTVDWAFSRAKAIQFRHPGRRILHRRAFFNHEE